MDVIILAAGENVRLQAAGLPPGLKPLMIVENEVLIRRLCRQARALSNGDIIIVCSPTNVQEVIFATKDYASHYVVQPEPIGPCDAVDRAIPLGVSEDVMLLMADNFIQNMPPFHNGFTPTVCVTRRHNLNLHPIRNGQYTTLSEHATGWWLGPVVFPKNLWKRMCVKWETAFSAITFQEWELKGVQDMGVLK